MREIIEVPFPLALSSARISCTAKQWKVTVRALPATSAAPAKPMHAMQSAVGPRAAVRPSAIAPNISAV